MVAFPTAFEDLPSPQVGDRTNSPDHRALHANSNDVVEALQRVAMGPIFESAANYSDLAEVVLHSADSLSDGSGAWTASGIYGAGSTPGPSVDTGSKTQGTGSVQAYMNTPGALGNRFSVDLTSPISVGGRTQMLIDIACSDEQGQTDNRVYWSVVIADATTLGGNTESIVLTTTNVPEADGAFHTIAVPVGSLTTIRSVGVKKTETGGSSGSRVRFHLDQPRLAAATPLDQAVKATEDGGVVAIPAQHTTAVSQLPIWLGENQAVFDLRRGQNRDGVYHAEDWYLDFDGVEPMDDELDRRFEALPDHSTVVFPSDGILRMETGFGLPDKTGVRVFGQGCRIYEAAEHNSAFFVVRGTQGYFGGFEIYGQKVTGPSNGSLLTTITGSPTISGTTTLIDAQNEEARIPLKTQGFCSAYGRDYQGRIEIDLVLSDSAQVASDCVVSFKNAAGTTTYDSTTLTLTGTPTTYTVYFTPTNLYEPTQITVKKSTATTNTITITSYTEYRRQDYDANFAFNHGIKAARVANYRIDDLWIEGVGGDAVTSSDGTTVGLDVTRVKSRVCGRQGMSFNQGSHYRVRDCEILFSGRHSIDLEPETTSVEVTDLLFDNIYMLDPTLGFWASTAFPRVRRCNASRLTMRTTSSGHGPFFTGGWWGGALRDSRMTRDDAVGASTAGQVEFYGRDMQISGIVASGGVRLRTQTKGAVGNVPTDSDYISVRDWQALNPDTLETYDITHSDHSDVRAFGTNETG